MIFLFQLIRTSIFLNTAMHVIKEHDTKEIVEFPNGFKVNYMNNENRKNTVIDFRIELYDLPSNTGLYHLLEHLLYISLKRFTLKKAGSFYASTSVTSMSFSFELHPSFIESLVELFYKVLYNTKLEKTAIMREIQNIEEEVNGNPIFKNPLAFYNTQNFSCTDKYNLFKIGNKKYFDLYFKEYVSAGNFLGEEGIEKFSESNFSDMSEGYYELLIFMLNTRLRKFPMSVLVTTSSKKEEVIKMFKKFDKKQTELITSRKGEYNNSNKFNNVILIPCNRYDISISIKCPIPNNLYIVAFFLFSLHERLKEFFLDQFSIVPFLLDDQLYLSITLSDFYKFDPDMIALHCILKKGSGELISFDEIEYFFNNDSSVKNDTEIIKLFKKLIILVNILILETIEDVEINNNLIKEFYKKSMLLLHKSFPETILHISFIHGMINSAPFLLEKRNDKLVLNDFEIFREHLLTPSNYASRISFKSPDSLNCNPVDDFIYYFLPLKVSDIIKNKDNLALLPKFDDDKIKFDKLDVIPSNYKINSFSLVFKFGTTLDDKIALIFVKKILYQYEEDNSEYFSKLLAKISVIPTFQNMLVLTISSNSENFKNTLLPFLQTLKIFFKSLSAYLSFKNSFESIKKGDKILENETDEDIMNSVKTFNSYLDVFKRVYTKCVYFGRINKKLINRIKQEMESSIFNSLTEDNFPLVNYKLPIPCNDLEGFNSEYLCLHNKDANTCEELINNKIAFLLFKVNAGEYFLDKHSLGYNIKFMLSDFGVIQINIVTLKSKEEIGENIKRFIKNYNSRIDGLGSKDFMNLKRFMSKIFIEKEPFNDDNLNLYLSKWGFLENFSKISQRIERYIKNELSLDAFKKFLKMSLSNNLQSSLEIE